jgi:hypothetical protein
MGPQQQVSLVIRAILFFSELLACGQASISKGLVQQPLHGQSHWTILAWLRGWSGFGAGWVAQ